jgi:glutaredoxin
MRIRGAIKVRIKYAPPLALALLLIGTSASIVRPALADDAPLSGTWKLVVLPYGEDEFAIFKLNEKEGTTTASVADAQQMLEQPQVKGVDRKDGLITITLEGLGGSTIFKGRLAKDGPGAGKFLGTVNFRGSTYPARLETTTESKVSPITESTLAAKLREAGRERDPKAKIKMLEEAIKGNHSNPNSSLLYGPLLGAAQAAGLEVEKVRDFVNRWTEEAKPYGEEWLNDVRLRALRAISSSKSLAKLTIELAQEAEKAVSEKDVETRVTVIGFLARAARESGMVELAKESEARHAKLDQLLDEEYPKKVPPFKPTAFSGRKDTKADQVVVMELFTGAQCPPCVAADAAFDALLQTYKPVDFIGLQYHLHIPGPDPLTNNDSMARQKYFEVRSTPSTFFNGHSEAPGGGFMRDAQGKYNEYRAIIDKSLETAKCANIAVSATQAGDQLKIVASAEVTKKNSERKIESDTSKTDPNEEKKSGEEQGKPKQVLRLALTEESIHYVGGNKLRFHHHVVRAFPGGATGTELKDGKGKTEVTLSLADLKRELEKYLSDFTKTRAFPNPLPEIKLEKLAVVAFVQDDGDKSILHAVSVPVEIATP